MRKLLGLSAVLALVVGVAMVAADPKELSHEVLDKIRDNERAFDKSLHAIEKAHDDLADAKAGVDEANGNLADALDAVAGDIDTLIPLINQTQDPLLQQKLQVMFGVQAKVLEALHGAGGVAGDLELASALGAHLADLVELENAMRHCHDEMLAILHPNHVPTAPSFPININPPGPPPAEAETPTSSNPLKRIQENQRLLIGVKAAVNAKIALVNKNVLPGLLASSAALISTDEKKPGADKWIKDEIAALEGTVDPTLGKKLACLKSIVDELDSAKASMANGIDVAVSDLSGLENSVAPALAGASAAMDALERAARNR